MERTIVVMLNVTSEQSALSQTLKEHTECFNFNAQVGFESKCSNSVELHKKTYRRLRSLYNLPSQLQIAARVKAAEAVKSALTWEMKQALYIERAKKNGKPLPRPITTPYSKCAPIRYDQRSYWVNWDSMTASLLTVNGRIKVPFTANKHAAQYIGYETRSADLCFRNGHFYLHIVVSIPAPVVEPTQEVSDCLESQVSFIALVPLMSTKFKISNNVIQAI